MRCHFHIIAPDGPITDRKGVEVGDLDQALEEALSAIRELREEDPRNGQRLGRLRAEDQ